MIKSEAKGTLNEEVFLMPWESRTVKEQREEFVEAAGNGNISKLCREFGISRPTAYKWMRRAQAGLNLNDASRAPHRKPGKTDETTERCILSLREDNPAWGGKTIRKVLENQGCENLPCIKTVCNILKRNGCISPEESLKHMPFQRFEKEECNEMWQTDFKGEFLTKDGRYCYPLDILDDHSRFLIKIAPSESTRSVVIPAFREAFEEFGMPRSVLSDNGAQFAGFRKGYTQFEKWLMDLDVLPIHGRIKHPQTQGKIERLHRMMKAELLNGSDFEDIADAEAHLQEWRKKYNEIRPHEALQMRCPAQVYRPSSRRFLEKIPKFEYSGQYHIIKVNSWGYVRFDKWQIYLSETMIGEYIEFRLNPNGDSFSACYRNFTIAEFSTQTGELIYRRISRL